MNTLLRRAGVCSVVASLAGTLAFAASQVQVKQQHFTADGELRAEGASSVRRASFSCVGDFGNGLITAEVSVDGDAFTQAQTAGGGAIACASDCTRQLLSGENGPYSAFRLVLSGANATDIHCVLLLAVEEGV